MTTLSSQNIYSLPLPIPTLNTPEEQFLKLGISLNGHRIQGAAARALRLDHPILIVGESGTGKEVVARYIHQLRKRLQGIGDDSAPFTAINLGAVPEGLAESVLFGHERGAFTSARERQLGKFELAKTGTLFLDEIEEAPLSLQAKLLRVIQFREFDRIGGKTPVISQCQVVAASNVPLKLLKEKKQFRTDLYYRLHVSPIYLPALRQRREDLPAFINHFLERFRVKTRSLRKLEVSADVFQVLLSHEWPGNLRELEHVVTRMALNCSGNTITTSDLPEEFNGELTRYIQEGQWEHQAI